MGKAPIFVFSTINIGGNIMGVSQEVSVLNMPNLGLFQSTVGYKFDGRGTVSLLIVHHSKGVDRVLLAKTKKGNNWILPQGEFDASDTKPFDAFIRNGFKQFGLKDSHFSGAKRATLGEFINEIPPERKAGCDKKHMLFIGMQISSSSCVKLIDSRKYTDIIWVGDIVELKRLMAENNRQRKFTATCQALAEAKKRDLISWDCGEGSDTH